MKYNNVKEIPLLREKWDWDVKQCFAVVVSRKKNTYESLHSDVSPGNPRCIPVELSLFLAILPIIKCPLQLK